MQSLIPSLQELSWRKLTALFEALATRLDEDGQHYISPRVVTWLEKIPDFVRAGLYERCLTSKLSLPTLMHFMAVSPDCAPTHIDLRRSQRFNLAQLFAFVIKGTQNRDCEQQSMIRMEAAAPVARRIISPVPGAPQARSSGVLQRAVSPGPYQLAPSPASSLFQRVKSALTALRSVDVSANMFFNDVTMIQVASFCPNLESLNISYCKNLNTSSISSALANCASSLTLLDLSWSGVTDNSLRALSMLSNLEVLAMSFCKNCSGAGITSLIESPAMTKLASLDVKGCNICPGAFRSKSLTHLNIGHTAVADATLDSIECPALTELIMGYCTKMTDDALSRLVNRCKQLRLLDLQFCSELTAPLFSLPELRVLLINECKSFSDLALQSICSHCHMLSEVQARGTQISDHTLRALASYGHLQVLNLSRCPYVSEVGLRVIVTNCTYLRDVDVSFNNALGSMQMLQLFEACCSNLKSLKIFGCSDISSDVIHGLKKQYPHLSISCATNALDWAMYSSIS